MSRLCIFSIFVVIIQIYGHPTTEIVSVQVIFRHGERTPVKPEFLFAQTNASAFEPFGIGHLTNKGKLQEYQIGVQLRKLYAKFLGNTHKHENVYAYASGLARTRESLQLVLAGLFPPTSDLEWNSQLAWNPIATHSYPVQIDILLNGRNCPTYLKALSEFSVTPTGISLFAPYKELFRYFENYFNRSLDMHDIFSMYNVALSMRGMNLTQPAWYSDEIFSKLTDYTRFYFRILAYKPEFNRRHAGPLLKQFIDNIESQRREKIILYSGHEYNIYAIVHALGFSLPTFDRVVSFGSALILETHRDNKNKRYVTFKYYDGLGEKLYPIKLPINGCKICYVQNFIELSKKSMPTKDEMMCLLKEIDSAKLTKIFSY